MLLSGKKYQLSILFVVEILFDTFQWSNFIFYSSQIVHTLIIKPYWMLNIEGHIELTLSGSKPTSKPLLFFFPHFLSVHVNLFRIFKSLTHFQIFRSWIEILDCSFPSIVIFELICSCQKENKGLWKQSFKGLTGKVRRQGPRERLYLLYYLHKLPVRWHPIRKLLWITDFFSCYKWLLDDVNA